MLAAVLFAALLQTPPAAPPTSPPELTPDQWREAARQDVEAIHDTLRDNAPFMVVDRDSADMRRWLDTGRTEALDDLPKVNDGRGYYYVLARYVGGFRDGHISLGLTKGAIEGRMPDWPGFAMTWRNGRYEVGWVQPGLEARTPPIGAVLVSCDGRPAEALAQERLDRLFGNMKMEAQRSALAFQLLRDYHYPVPAPAECVFRTPEGEKSWKLAWSTPTDDLVNTAAAELFAPRARFGVSRWGDNAWWIGAPTMMGEENWKALYTAIDANLAAIRRAEVVVIDLRGNRGGNSDYGDRLAHQLFGDSVANASAVAWGDLVFKDGPLSRKWAADGVAQSKDSPEWLASIKPISDKLDAAPLGSKVLIPAGELPARVEQPPSPMKGRVVVVIDHACFSACLDTLDVFTRLPGVELAGVETGADTIFMDGVRAPLPSGKASLSFGIKAWVQRQRGSNIPYRPDPSLTYTGSLADETALKRWLAVKLGVTGI
jgi:hypothetical protein